MAYESHRPHGTASPPVLLGIMVLVLLALGLLGWILLDPGGDRGPVVPELGQADPTGPGPDIDLVRNPQPGDPPAELPPQPTSADPHAVREGPRTNAGLPDVRNPGGGTTYTFVGQVLDEATNKPVEHFAIFLLPAAEGDIRKARDDATPNVQARNQLGRFELLFQPPGVYNLLVETITHKDLVLEGVRIPQDQELVLRLQKGTYLYGKVTDDLGTPLGKFPVILHPVQMDPGFLAPRRTRATTDPRGAFQFDKLPPGTYWMSAGDLGNPDAVIQEFYLGHDQALEKSFRIPRLVTVKVIAKTAEGAAIPRARVSLLPATEGSDATKVQLKAAYTDRDGTARLPFVREGTYRLLIQLNQFISHEEELYISEGNPYLELERVLQRQVEPGH